MNPLPFYLIQITVVIVVFGVAEWWKVSAGPETIAFIAFATGSLAYYITYNASIKTLHNLAQSYYTQSNWGTSNNEPKIMKLASAAIISSLTKDV